MVVKAAVIFAALALAGCGASLRQQIAEKEAAVSADEEICRQQFPDRKAQGVARARCINESVSRHIRPIHRSPDLIDRVNASRVYIAEQVQQGKISDAQADVEFAKIKSEVISEDQNRANANQAVAAQQAVATAQTVQAINSAPIYQPPPPPRTIICNRMGTMTMCN